ncbi:DNA-3-methyladenine glycosylase [Bordetella bronchiseptica]|uniref:DNA-3-methyladenine glycosylase n=1 Tax=Bordetella bronchiseptica TaxID=518 RepID=UPI003F743DA3
MDREELLALMISTPAPAPNLNAWDRVLVIYAEHLARLVSKLDEKDLGTLIASGAMFYRTLRQADTARLDALERWSSLPHPGDKPG